MGYFFGPPPLTADEALKLLNEHLVKQEDYLLAIAGWHRDHTETASILLRLGIDLGLLTEEQKKIEPAVKNELARNQAALSKVVSEMGDAIKRDILAETRKNTEFVKKDMHEVLAEIRNFSTLCESFSKHEAFMKKQVADIETTQRQNNMVFAKLMEKYASSFSKTAKENIGLRDEVKRIKKALFVAEKRILDLEQDKLFPEPSPTEPYELFDGETGERTLVIPRQKPVPVNAPQDMGATPKETSELDEMRARIETITSKVESLAASKQPQEPPAPAPARKEDAPFIETPAPSLALPVPVVMQASNRFVPKADDLLSYPNAARLGKKSMQLLQELAGILDRKVLFLFDLDNVRDWLEIEVATCYRHLGTWEQLGFIEKQANGWYRFLPPPTTPTTAAPTGHQEDSQPSV